MYCICMSCAVSKIMKFMLYALSSAFVESFLLTPPCKVHVVFAIGTAHSMCTFRSTNVCSNTDNDISSPLTLFFFSRSPHLILLHWHRMSREKKKLLKKWIVFFFGCNRFQFFIAFTMCYQSARVWNRNVITLLKIFFRIEQSFIGGEKHGTCWWHRYSSDEWKFYRWMRKCREKKARKRKNKIPLSSHNCSQWKVVKLCRQLIRFDWCLN